MIRIHRVSALLSVLALAGAAPSSLQAARPASACRVEVVVDGRAAAEYHALGARYVEALKGKDYAIRLHNPLDVRVAVALSVDGLNTIDAQHTTAAAGRKWVIGPHETVTISGWQTSMAQARRFFFTSEERSYAGRLGEPDNIGVISAVFFQERVPAVAPLVLGQAAGATRRDASKEAPAPAAAAERGAAGGAATAESAAASRDEFAATGIGERTAHPVALVHLDLEERPVTSIDIRYEYREQLVRLGVLPDGPGPPDPLARRQNARGFDKGFCPDIK
jgi:hypothetical protein